jgi:nicotinamidase/pyrazinamidase
MNQELIIIIDPQKDFTADDGNYATRHGITAIKAVKAHIELFLKAAGDKHGIVVCSDYRPGQFGDGLSICIPGTSGHEIDIVVPESVTLITKTEHSCFSSKAFKFYLRQQPVKRLVLCGFLAEYCVQQTALDALAHGYEVHLPEDYIGTGDDVQERKENMLTILKAKGAIVKHTF